MHQPPSICRMVRLLFFTWLQMTARWRCWAAGSSNSKCLDTYHSMDNVDNDSQFWGKRPVPVRKSAGNGPEHSTAAWKGHTNEERKKKKKKRLVEGYWKLIRRLCQLFNGSFWTIFGCVPVTWWIPVPGSMVAVHLEKIQDRKGGWFC